MAGERGKAHGLSPERLALLTQARTAGYKSGYSGEEKILPYEEHMVNLVWSNAYDVGEMHKTCGEPYGGDKRKDWSPGTVRTRLGYNPVGDSRRERTGEGSPNQAYLGQRAKDVQAGTQARGGAPSFRCLLGSRG